MTVDRLPLNLTSRKKWRSSISSRVKPVEETVNFVDPLCKKIGVTRIADITDMDRLRIANYSATLPGTEDYIWVYSGKGTTKLQAKASVMMECIERFCSLPRSWKKKFIYGSYDDLSKSHTVLHPNEVIEPLRLEYRNDMPMEFVEGSDLFTDEKILVPASLALFRYSPQASAVDPFAFHHTNGLASGNVIEEAVCHSLCEVIERDATSLAELRASAIPFHILRQVHDSLKSDGYALSSLSLNNFVDDPYVFADLNISELTPYHVLHDLVAKFSGAGIPLIIKDVTSDIGIPTFSVSSVEWLSHNYGYLTEGYGTHPQSGIALVRAITELSQSRAANIHGARDDLRKILYSEDNTDEKKAWQFMQSNKTVRLSDIRSFSNDDILDDIKLILGNLRRAGIRRAIIVDLSNEDIKIPVVRAILPGLETFKITKSIMGWRARRYLPGNG